MLALIIIISLLLVGFYIICGWRLFSKAGRPGWAILVPIYNLIVQFQVAKISPWLVLLYLLAIIPILGSIVMLALNIYVSIKTCKAFNKGTGFTIGYIFLGFIFMPILALGNSKYDFECK